MAGVVGSWLSNLKDMYRKLFRHFMRLSSVNPLAFDLLTPHSVAVRWATLDDFGATDEQPQSFRAVYE